MKKKEKACVVRSMHPNSITTLIDYVGGHLCVLDSVMGHKRIPAIISNKFKSAPEAFSGNITCVGSHGSSVANG